MNNSDDLGQGTGEMVSIFTPDGMFELELREGETSEEFTQRALKMVQVENPDAWVSHVDWSEDE